MIKVDTNSSVQDASNQTDSMISFGEEDDDGEDNDDDEDSDVLRIHEESEEPSKMKSDDEVLLEEKPAAEPQTKVYSVENPDFSGLQLLLNGIERAEHSRISPEVGDEVSKKDTGSANMLQTVPQLKKETEDSDTEKPVPNSLEILCALADQRFKEEKVAVSDEESSSSDSELKEQSRKEGKKVVDKPKGQRIS